MFNFNDSEDFDNFNDEIEEDVSCQCENCSKEITIEIVEHFVNQAAQVKSPTELFNVLMELSEFMKIQGIKEYIFESVNVDIDTLQGLDTITKNEQLDINDSNTLNDDENKDWLDIPHWKDRL